MNTNTKSCLSMFVFVEILVCDVQYCCVHMYTYYYYCSDILYIIEGGGGGGVVRV